jgi:IS30 family transposase
MSKNYKQLSLEQRYKIEALLKAGLTQKLVATYIGVHPSTISRELDRNVGKRGRLANTYQANNAQNKTVLCHSIKYKRITFTTKMRNFAVDKLCNQRWSPEFISENGKRILGDFVSHERLYQWI